MSLIALINIAVLCVFLFIIHSSNTPHYFFFKSSLLGFASSSSSSSVVVAALVSSPPINRNANDDRIDVDVDIDEKSKPPEIKTLSVKDYVSFSRTFQCRHEGMALGKVISISL